MDETAGIYAVQSAYLERHVQVGIAQGRVLSVEFPQTPTADASDEHDLLDRIEAYLQGERDDFADVEVAMTMPTDQREVLSAVRQIPYGEDATVEQVGHMAAGVEPDDDGGKIREALAANPAPIFVPTHRVRDGPNGMPAAVEGRLRTLEGL
ncbi:methylated-DNA-[protein]-cysteine S-methyltransferase [Halovenus aranensis]|jgi:methylated-DNA-[protein]-cysteine S-methyltransferase|uniref:Methylated-DNA-[protein]-cysteine S-methyltransferase n=1 Tax=Halovenus aranensis TaxID=890420 RepID=A0A1G8UEP2_9EURY|nr:MGMT family protein [Halovenus aranensis]SDJ51635.1 methylated-DNA-[protein]-cysteine S-methyltransferase [Halovenus aranensis]